MNLELPVQARIKMLDSQISQCSQDLITLPEGDLHVGRNGKYYTWKWKDAAGNWHYISKSNEEEAVQRALRKLYQAQLHDLASEREACRRYAHYKKQSVSEINHLMEKESPEFKRLLQKALTFPDDRVTAWENQSYQKSLVHPDALIHPTLKPDLFVRSKVEAMVSSSMTLTRIPHLYEKIIHIDRWEIAADFTALDIRTFREIPIEVFGMMDDPEYRKSYERKMKTYIDGGYIPGKNMLVFYEFSDDPLSQAVVMDELDRFFFRNPPFMH